MPTTISPCLVRPHRRLLIPIRFANLVSFIKSMLCMPTNRSISLLIGNILPVWYYVGKLADGNIYDNRQYVTLYFATMLAKSHKSLIFQV